MNELLSKLVALQNLDTRLLADKAELAGIPERLKQTERVLDGAKAREEEFRAKLNAASKSKKSREMELEDSLQRIKTLKGRMSEVKTNMEYQARLKEIAAAEESSRRIEDAILEIMEQVELVEKDRPAVEEALRGAHREWENTKKRVEERGEKLQAEIERLMAERGPLVQEIPRELYEQYRTLMQERRGAAVVRVRAGVCEGCQMNIPPQFFNEIRASEKIYTCPSCDRLLYYMDDLAAGESHQ